MKITTCLLVLINQSRTESYEFVSSLSAHDSSQREIQKTGISYMITMGWTHLLILSCVTQLPSIWCSCLLMSTLLLVNNLGHQPIIKCSAQRNIQILIVIFNMYLIQSIFLFRRIIFDIQFSQKQIFVCTLIKPKSHFFPKISLSPLKKYFDCLLPFADVFQLCYS